MAHPAPADATRPGSASPARSHAWRVAAGLAALVALRTGLDLAALADAPARYRHVEEAYNATLALVLGHGALWARLLTLQYKAFCGGCTVVSAAGAPFLGLLGDQLLAWKALALCWSAATLLAAFFAVRRAAGQAAAWGAAALLAFPTTGLSDLSLMLWGNHTESALVVLLALGLALGPRPWLGALLAGVAVWFCRTSLYAVPAVLLAALTGARGWMGRLAALASAAKGGALMLVPAADGDWGTYRMGERLVPAGGATSWERLAPYLDPGPLAPRAFLGVPGMAAWAGVLLVAAALGWIALLGRRQAGPWALAALPVGWLAARALTDFATFPVLVGSPVGSIRYHGPWLLLLALVAGAGGGLLLRAGGWRRGGGGVLLAAVLGAHGRAWWAVADDWSPEPGWASESVQTGDLFERIVSARLGALGLLESLPDDPTAGPLLARVAGLQLGHDLVEKRRTPEQALALARASAWAPAVLEGLGAAWMFGPEGVAAANRVLATLAPAEADALGHGMQVALGAGLGRRQPRGSPAEQATALAAILREGLAPEEPCRLCPAAGRVIATHCRRRQEGRRLDPEAVAACLAEAASAVPGEALLAGAGAVFGPESDEHRAAPAIARALDAAGADGDTFLEAARGR